MSIRVYRVLTKSSCRGCGSDQHKTPCCPNKQCPCCADYHPHGIRDCPIAKQAMARVKANKQRDQAAAKRAAGKAAASEARQHLLATKRQALAAKTTKYNELLQDGMVEHNKSYWTYC